MSITNFGELKTAIANYAHRSDLTDMMSTFVSLASSRINKMLRVKEMEERATDSISSSPHPTPNDMIEMRNFQITNGGNREALRYLTPEQIDAEYGSAGSGLPRAYTVFDSQIELGPTPDGTYAAEMYYIAKVSALSADSDTNDVLTYYPEIYLYASLMEAAIYTEDDELAQKWLGLFEQEVYRANEATKRARYSGNSLQVRAG